MLAQWTVMQIQCVIVEMLKLFVLFLQMSLCHPPPNRRAFSLCGVLGSFSFSFSQYSPLLFHVEEVCCSIPPVDFAEEIPKKIVILLLSTFKNNIDYD